MQLAIPELWNPLHAEAILALSLAVLQRLRRDDAVRSEATSLIAATTGELLERMVL
jgi:hypothetical protein